MKNVKDFVCFNFTAATCVYSVQSIYLFGLCIREISNIKLSSNDRSVTESNTRKIEKSEHTVFGVVVRQGEGVIRIGGVPAQLSVLCVVHSDCVF